MPANITSAPIVLIAGPSASGKSTVARLVATARHLPLLCLDDYFIRGRREFIGTAAGRVRTYERPTLYDGGSLAKDARAARAGVVVEGFCLLMYPEFAELEAFRFYLDVPHSVCAERRAKRRPSRPSDESFSLIGEAEAAKYVLPQRFMPNVQVLDGMLPPADLARCVQQTLLSSKECRAGSRDNFPYETNPTL